MKNIRNAITYPVMMVGMLLIVLFVLFTRVMPVFEQVYAQLGVQMSPFSQAALTAANSGGRSFGRRPRLAPRALAAAIPSACRCRINLRSVSAT